MFCVQLITPEEMCDEHIDELSMMTYLSQFPSAKLNQDVTTGLQLQCISFTSGAYQGLCLGSLSKRARCGDLGRVLQPGYCLSSKWGE